MSVADAQTAQGMATRHRKSVKAVVQGIGHINALLRRCIKNNQIKWEGYGDEFDWYVRKLDETASWTSGQLGKRTFEEKDPIDKASLHYCFLDRTYGIGEASIKTNRAAGPNKIYDIQKENARVAQSAMYRAMVAALYSNAAGSVASGPAGFRTILGNPVETSNVTVVAAGKAYAGITMNSSAIAAYSAAKAGYSAKYWAPEVACLHEIATALGQTTDWSVSCLYALAWIVTAMSRTQDVSGTGKVIKPDLALMNIDPYNAMWTKLIAGKIAAGPIQLSDADFSSVGINNVVVGPLTCVYDENVPGDTNTTPLEMVIVTDSKAFAIETLNTKSEGLVEGEWKQKDPEVVGGYGAYKSNLGYRIDSPVSAGAILGCNS